jgi:ribonuclease E
MGVTVFDPDERGHGVPVLPESRDALKATHATIAAAAAHAHDHPHDHEAHDAADQDTVLDQVHEGRGDEGLDEGEEHAVEAATEASTAPAEEPAASPEAPLDAEPTDAQDD